MSDVIHALTCPIRRRWLRWRIGIPFWRDDKTAAMLGVAHLGCRRCGRGWSRAAGLSEGETHA